MISTQNLSDSEIIAFCGQYKIPVRYLDNFSRVLDRQYANQSIVAYFTRQTVKNNVNITFETVALQNSYTQADVSSLIDIVDKDIFMVTLDGSIVTKKFYSWDNVTFTFIGVDITDLMEVLIMAQ